MSSNNKRLSNTLQNTTKYQIRKQKIDNIRVIPIISPIICWDCKLYNKQLSSKQRLINHFNTFHLINSKVANSLSFTNYVAEDINSYNYNSKNNTNLFTNLNKTKSQEGQANSNIWQESELNNNILSDNEDIFTNIQDDYESVRASESQEESNSDSSNLESCNSVDDLINTSSYNPYTNNFSSNFQDQGSFPFPNAGTAILQALLVLGQSRITKNIMKKILLSIKLFINLYKDHLKDNPGEEFKLPTLNSIYSFKSKNYNPIQKFPTTEVTINKNGKEYTSYMNLPSKYLTYLFGSPDYCKYLYDIPNRTPNKFTSLNQNFKWNNHDLFKCRYLKYNNISYWSSDIYLITNSNGNKGFLIESFYKLYNDIIAEGYIVYNLRSNQPIIDSNLISININYLNQTKVNKLNPKYYLTYNRSIYSSIINIHRNLIVDKIPGKVCKDFNKTGASQFYPLRIAPIILFTDDMNRGSHKNILYETITIQFPGSRLGSMYSSSNIFFVAAVKNSKGLNAIDLIPRLTEDLLMLENGIKVFSIVDNEYITVISPLLWVNADNPAHNGLCGLKATSSNYPCRKCFVDLTTCYKSDPKYLKLHNLEHYIVPSATRHKGFYLQADNIYKSLNLRNLISTYNNVGFKQSIGSKLLSLQSFNPSIDIPVEILHTLCLGVIKDIVIYTFDHYKHYGIPIRKVNEIILQVQRNNNFTPQFSYKLDEYTKFNGKDYKSLIQILPLVMYHRDFNIPGLKNINQLISTLANICSIIYTNNIIINLNGYYKYLNIYINKLITILYKIEKLQNKGDHKAPIFLHKLKFHLLVHLIEDIKNFGPATQFSTETFESYNKKVQQIIQKGNFKGSEKDLANKLGNEFMLQFIIKQGTWIVEGVEYTISKKLSTFLNSTGEDFTTLMFPNSTYIPQIATQNTKDYINLQQSAIKYKKQYICIVSITNSNASTLPKLLLLYINGTLLEQLYFNSNTYTKDNCITAYRNSSINNTQLYELEFSLEHIFNIIDKDYNKFVINLNKLGSLWYYLLLNTPNNVLN